MRTTSLLLALTGGLAGASPVEGQAVLSLPGKTVEVIGLQRWTIQMMQDSIAKYAPGESLASHACAAVLRYKLGFAEASSTTYLGWTRGDTTPRIVVAVVEPQDSARIRHRSMPMDSTAPFSPWVTAVALVAKSPGVVEAAVSSYLKWRLDSVGTAVPGYARRDSTSVRAYWHFLADHARPSDFADARRILLGDRDYRNRTVAASILANFVDRDSSWYALVEAVRESDGLVKVVSGVVLSTASRDAKRPVDWTPAAPSLHSILDGTSLFQLPVVIDALLATGVDRRLAHSLLGRGGRMLLSFMEAQHPAPRGSAHRLLVALAGQDLGDDVGKWRSWIDGL